MPELPWPFRRRRAAESPPASAGTPVAERAVPAWRDLPPIAAAVTSVLARPASARSVEFVHDLPTRWRQPPALEPLGHDVRHDAAPGLVAGLVVPLHAADPRMDTPRSPLRWLGRARMPAPRRAPVAGSPDRPRLPVLPAVAQRHDALASPAEPQADADEPAPHAIDEPAAPHAIDELAAPHAIDEPAAPIEEPAAPIESDERQERLGSVEEISTDRPDPAAPVAGPSTPSRQRQRAPLAGARPLTSPRAPLGADVIAAVAPGASARIDAILPGRSVIAAAPMAELPRPSIKESPTAQWETLFQRSAASGEFPASAPVNHADPPNAPRHPVHARSVDTSDADGDEQQADATATELESAGADARPSSSEPPPAGTPISNGPSGERTSPLRRVTRRRGRLGEPRHDAVRIDGPSPAEGIELRRRPAIAAGPDGPLGRRLPAAGTAAPDDIPRSEVPVRAPLVAGRPIVPRRAALSSHVASSQRVGPPSAEQENPLPPPHVPVGPPGAIRQLPGPAQPPEDDPDRPSGRPARTVANLLRAASAPVHNAVSPLAHAVAPLGAIGTPIAETPIAETPIGGTPIAGTPAVPAFAGTARHAVDGLLNHRPRPAQEAAEDHGVEHDAASLDRLAGQLYGRLRSQLASDLLVGRERAQLLTDL